MGLQKYIFFLKYNFFFGIFAPQSQNYLYLKQIYRSHPHFILYSIFGIVSTGVEFVVFALLIKQISYYWANVIAFHCGIICSFLLNRRYNFKKEDKVILRFTTFYLIQIICLALNTLILYLCINLAHLNPLIAKGISIVMTALLPFFLNRSITFGKRI